MTTLNIVMFGFFPDSKKKVKQVTSYHSSVGDNQVKEKKGRPRPSLSMVEITI
jgi:hypothetical protein